MVTKLLLDTSWPDCQQICCAREVGRHARDTCLNSMSRELLLRKAWPCNAHTTLGSQPSFPGVCGEM